MPCAAYSEFAREHGREAYWTHDVVFLFVKAPCCLVPWGWKQFVHQKYWYHQSKHTKATTFVIPVTFCDTFRPDYSTKVRDRKTKHCLCVEVFWRLCHGSDLQFPASNREACFQYQLSNCCVGKSGSGSGFPPSTSVSPRLYHSTNTPPSASSTHFILPEAESR